MTAPRRVFDCRGGDPARVVAGLPLCCRHVRVAARAAAREVTLLVDDDDDARAAVAAALAWRRPPPGVAVVAIARPPEPGEEALPGLAVYVAADGGLTALAEVRDAAGAAAAERLLVARLRKSVELDGFIAYHTMRPLSRLMSRLLVGTRVTPNQVTLAALVLGLLGAVLAAAGTYTGVLLGGLLFWLGGVVDCVDGELARLRVEGSRLGEWLDIIADNVATLGLNAGLGLGIGAPWSTVGLVALVVGAVTAAKIHIDLHHLGLPIDSVYYPWAFHRASTPGEAKGLSVVAYLFRRDAFVTFVALFCAAGLPRVAFLTLFSGTAILSLMLAAHLVLRKA